MTHPTRRRRRKNTLVGLRSLFAFCKKNGHGLSQPHRPHQGWPKEYGVIQPLSSGRVDEAVPTATNTAASLVLALAAVHSAQSGAICALRLDEVDLANRRLVIAGGAGPLDDHTVEVFQGWLDHRRARWPSTANPHLFINQHTAAETGPVSTFWAKKALRPSSPQPNGKLKVKHYTRNDSPPRTDH